MPVSPAASRWMAEAVVSRALREAGRSWRLLNFEQKVTAVGALLLAVSTFGPFSFVEAAELLIAGALLALLYARAQGRRFHLPFGDGTVILAAGIWAALLISVRLFDRSLGQNLLALVCSGILIVAGAAERAKRPADDIPPGAEPHQPEADAGGGELEPGGEQDGLGGAEPGGDGPGDGGAQRQGADLEPGGGREDLPQ
jgi:hypothetical protein